MKVINYIGQILAAPIYTCLFTGIMYFVIILPLAYIITLPWWAMLMVIFIAGGILEGLISLLTAVGTIPFVWIVKKNTVALVIASFIAIFNIGCNIVKLWQVLLGNGFWAILFAIIATSMLLQFAYVTIFSLIGLYSSSKEQ